MFLALHCAGAFVYCGHISRFHFEYCFVSHMSVIHCCLSSSLYGFLVNNFYNYLSLLFLHERVRILILLRYFIERFIAYKIQQKCLEHLLKIVTCFRIETYTYVYCFAFCTYSL